MAKTDLSGILTSVGAPFLKKLIESNFPPPLNGLGAAAVDVLAQRLGAAEATPEAIVQRYEADPGAGATIVRQLEADPQTILASVQQQNATNALLLAEMREPLWTWAWRPAWMWGLLIAWAWYVFVVPIVNFAMHASGAIADVVMIVDIATLIAVTGIFAGLYMGGHTVKEVIGKKWRGA